MNQKVIQARHWNERVTKLIDILFLPLINLFLAFFVAGIVVYILGEDPYLFFKVLFDGAFGEAERWGYTLFYTTTFIFTGLSVAIAYHCGLFNIGGEGQLYVGGLGVTIVFLLFWEWPWYIIFLLSIVFAGGIGAIWGFVPGYLQAKRGSHIVITTIMFNFIAAAFMSYMIINIFMPAGHPNPESIGVPLASRPPQINDILLFLGLDIGIDAPLNFTLLLALFSCFLFWVFIWHTRWGYEIRIVGKSEDAANYSGIATDKIIILAMVMAGFFAGLGAINIILGDQFRLVQGFSTGFGFVGIAVALMGRNHPIGIILAALLFGALEQGASELDFELDNISRDFVRFIQGLIILFCGAFELMVRPGLQMLLLKKTHS